MPVDLALQPLLIVAAIGLIAGVLGGMLGVGGSVIMIPGLTLAFGPDQHLYQAAAMIANIAVAVPAALKHRQKGATDADVLKWMLPAAVGFVLVGVWLSNLAVFQGDGTKWLRRLFAAFLAYVVILNTWKFFSGLARRRRAASATEPGTRDPEPVADGDTDAERRPSITPFRSTIAGVAMGVIAGLLGVGGGAIAVPLQQVLLKLPLRRCIANSSVIICFSAALGALYKNASLTQHVSEQTGEPLAVWAGVLVAALLAPTAIVGGRLGAGLTHVMSPAAVRVAFITLMAVACWRMAVQPSAAARHTWAGGGPPVISEQAPSPSARAAAYRVEVEVRHG